MALIVSPGDSDVRTRGMFVQGHVAMFYLTFTDIDGYVYDPISIDIRIIDPDGTVVDSLDNPNKIDTGEFVAQWNVAADDETGAWTFEYTFVAATTTGDVSTTVEDVFIVVESGNSTLATRAQYVTMKAYFESLIKEAQNIPVKAEPIMWLNESDRRIGKLTFPQWNQPASANVWRNNNKLESGYDINWLRGEITFDYPLESFDKIDIDYNFRWFDDNTIDGYMDSGIQRVNYYPPVSWYEIGTVPNYWIYVSMWGAAVDALRSLIFDLAYQEPEIVYGTKERAEKAFNIFDKLKQNYEEDLKTALDMKKFGPYPGIANIVVPEYTLPGGRCLAYYSLVSYRILKAKNEDFPSSAGTKTMVISENVYTKSKIDTIENVYKLLKNGNQIEVLSDKNGQPSFEPVSKIWKSGQKPLIRIEAETGDYVDVSKEHTMFVNGEEMPAQDVRKGDILSVFHKNKIIDSPVKSIKPIENTETFDIEVPSTQNLFVDGIKCHNSRWFRYLFKSGVG